MIYFHALHEDVRTAVINSSASSSTALGRGTVGGIASSVNKEYEMLGRWVVTIIGIGGNWLMVISSGGFS